MSAALNNQIPAMRETIRRRALLFGATAEDIDYAMAEAIDWFRKGRLSAVKAIHYGLVIAQQRMIQREAGFEVYDSESLHLSEEEQWRLGHGFELIQQGLLIAQDGRFVEGSDLIESGLLMIKPSSGMAPPPWVSQVEREKYARRFLNV